MSETTRVVVPYESMDPLAIGATDDESKKHRDTLELDIPSTNLLTVVQPDEPAPVADATEAARDALAQPVDGPTFADLLEPASAAWRSSSTTSSDRPRPRGSYRRCSTRSRRRASRTSASAARMGRSSRCPSRTPSRSSARRTSRGWSATGGRSHQNDPRNRDAYAFVGVSSGGTPVWLHCEVAQSELKITIGQAQANHWGAGGGGKLILPGVVSDETIESNHCAFVTSPQTHYGAYVGPMRSDIDEVATMCGLDCTMNVMLDTHGRVIDVVFGSHPEAHREAIRRFNDIYAYESFVPERGQADIAICGVFAPTDHLFFHTGWGCMSADLVVKDGGTLIYCSPSPGVSTAIGDFPGFALMDLMKPYMPATRRTTSASCATSTRGRSRCGRGASGCRSTRS